MQNQRFFYYFLAAVSVLKVWLVAGNEIVAVPYDSASYVKQAADHLFGLGAAPGYPFWLALSGWSGLPQRISIELLLILCSGVLSCWLRRMFGPVCGGLAFVLLVLSPATYFLFDYALTDGFYACLGILGITFSGAVIFSVSSRTKILAAASLGLTVGWMALVRNEDPLLMAWVGLVLVLLLVHSSRTKPVSLKRSGLAVTVLAAIAIAVPAVAVVQGVSLMHLRESGVYARTLAALPGHTRLLRNLAEIDNADRSVRYVPVSAKARALAYEASPTLRKYMKIVEDRDSIFQQVSREAGLPPGEIGAGWIWHVFNVAILQANGVVGGEAEYEKINRELNEGFRSGALKRRFVLHSFAAAPPMDIASRLPSAAWKVAEKAFQTYPRGVDVGHEKQLFDAVALRRAALISEGYRHVIQGWAFLEGSPQKIVSVTLVDGAGRNLVVATPMARADVEDGFKRPDGTKPSAFGFSVDVQSSSQDPGRLVYALNDGSTHTSSEILNGVRQYAAGVGSGSTLYQGIDTTVVEPVRQTGYRQRVQDEASAAGNLPWASKTILLALLVLGVVAVVAGRRLTERRFDVGMFSLLIAGLFLLRVVFYAVLESEAWVVEVRYMLAANFMAAVLFAVLLPFCIRAGREALRSRAAGG